MANGYVRVLQDSRGKGKSEGVYRPFADDVEDGYDTIEWMAKQPWSNGKVGMSGISAMAIATYNAAMSGAPHFVAAFVTAGRGFTTPDGGVPMQHIEDWSRRQGVAPSNNPRPTFRTWGPIGPRDLRAFSDKIAIPFYNVGGWYDIFEKGILDGYTFLHDHGAPSVRNSQRLMLAAFGHGPLSGELEISGRRRRHLNGRSDPLVRLLDERCRQRHHEGTAREVLRDGRYERHIRPR